ncbi:MAG TPA: Rne/Rng family ribonuclease [Vicinamibacteria bacterium]|nr:Rne/Rng family ribonuclease [Vicinamibacteria bacterium]
MIVSHSALQTRLAILEDGVVSEVAFERERSRGVAGNIYKGRVNRVLPGMQSAFVDVGLERDAFLYVSDVLEDDDYLTEEEEKIVETEREIRAAKGDGQSIDQLLTQGQEVLVQVAKEPLGTKGARITSYVSLPGRLLVYMPTVDHIGVSRKIESAEERARLRKLIQKARQRSGGFIVRTAAQGKDDETIVADLRYLEQKWNEICQKADHLKAPALVHKDLGLVFKYIRDVLSPEFSAIRINSEEVFDQVLNYVRQIQPQLLHRVKYYSKNYPIFEEYGVQSEIDKALRSKVWLKSGGYIVINQTEALVAIDVNTGRYTGEKRLEDTITRINLEAADEIVHQIRLRDLGGIIVIDFIDMEERRNQHKVFAALEQALRRDRSPTKSVQINEFGLVVLTRKRVKRSLERVLCRPCPLCQGSSWVKSPTTVAYEIVDEVRKSMTDFSRGLTLRVHPEVARALKGKEAPVVEELKSMLKQDVEIRADHNIYQEQYELVARK